MRWYFFADVRVDELLFRVVELPTEYDWDRRIVGCKRSFLSLSLSTKTYLSIQNSSSVSLSRAYIDMYICSLSLCVCVSACVKGINSDAWYYYHTSSLFRAKDATREVFLMPWQTTAKTKRWGWGCLQASFSKHPKPKTLNA